MNSSPSLESTAQALVASGTGILAADESLPTIGKRFAALAIPSTEENRRTYRELLFTTPGLSKSISGVILFDETLRQRPRAGFSPLQALVQQGIIPGIKVDAGTTTLPGFAGEKFTQGLDGLRQRLTTYRDLGARFTKWRAVITIGDGLPTRASIMTNARALALFAALSQEAGLVPIVEPEVLMEGHHSLARCEEVTCATLQNVFALLAEHRVRLEAMLLKTGMVLAGKVCPRQANLATVAEATLRCLHRSVPAAVPGIVFLSGGQNDVVATERLNAICQAGTAPWKLSFSFGRALQDTAMKTWNGDSANGPAAQAALQHRAKCNGRAVQGRYSSQLEHESTTPGPLILAEAHT